MHGITNPTIRLSLEDNFAKVELFTYTHIQNEACVTNTLIECLFILTNDFIYFYQRGKVYHELNYKRYNHK